MEFPVKRTTELYLLGLYNLLHLLRNYNRLLINTVVRRAKQGASYQVKDLLFQNLASRNYRVLQLC